MFEEAPSGRVADRLASIRQRHFIGRLEEIEAFRAAFMQPEPDFSIIFVHGPGGIGKSALLEHYARLAEEAGARTVRIDGRNVEPSPAGFSTALGAALHLEPASSALETLSSTERLVLLIDTYEALANLDGWLRADVVPRFPANSIVVFGSRSPPSTAWLEDPGWRQLVRVVPLRNLRPEEADQYLKTRGVATEHREIASEFTHGHPLALSLVADFFAFAKHEDGVSLRPSDSPQLIDTLLKRFVEQVPSTKHREALHVCAHARVTTQSLLSEILGGHDARALFDWLRGLSFIEQGPEGLFPHDLARDVLDMDLRWRDPQGYRELHGRILTQVVRGVQDSGPRVSQASIDKIFMTRYSPTMRPFFEPQTVPSASVEPARPDDRSMILELVERCEGQDSARIASYWWEQQPSAFHVARSQKGELVGFNANLLLSSPSSQDIKEDPAIERITSFIATAGPLRQDECISVHRFWMSRDEYQGVRAQTWIAMTASRIWLTTPRLAWSFPTGIAEPDRWAPMFAQINFSRIPETDFEVGGRRYGTFAHDWRVEPPELWMARLTERELSSDQAVDMPIGITETSLLVLSRPEFEKALRHALRDYTRPEALKDNPLLRSRLILEDGIEDGVRTLQQLLRDAVGELKRNPRDAKLFRALWYTYIEPAPTQEAAAEMLGLPFSTYRYHLARGLERLTDALWARELQGSTP